MLTSTQRARFDNTSPFEDLHKPLHQKLGVLKCVYDFDVDGGAVGAISMKDDLGNPAILPDNAIITKVYFDTITAITSAGLPTISVGVNTAVDLLATGTAIAAFSGITAGIPDGAVANMVKLTAQRQVTWTIENVAAATVTAGKVNVYVEFVLSD